MTLVAQLMKLSCANLESVSCAVCSVRKRALFQVVPEAQIEQAQAARLTQCQISARQHIYHKGDQSELAYTVFEGWVMLYRSHSDGSRQGLRIALPGDFIGYLPHGMTMQSHSAVAITPTVLCAFRNQAVHAMLEQGGALAMQVARMLGQELDACQGLMLGLGRKSAQQRIAYVLAELYSRLSSRGLVVAERNELRFPLTQEMLGDLAGLTPVHTNRVLRSLRDAGVIRIERQRLQVLDAARLAHIGGFKSDRAYADRESASAQKPS